MNKQAEKCADEIESAYHPLAHSDDFIAGLNRAAEIVRRHFAGPDPLMEELRALANELDGPLLCVVSVNQALKSIASRLHGILAKHGHGEKP